MPILSFFAEMLGKELFKYGTKKAVGALNEYINGKSSYRNRLKELFEAHQQVLREQAGERAWQRTYFWELEVVRQKVLQYRIGREPLQLLEAEVAAGTDRSLAAFSQAGLDDFCQQLQAKFGADEKLRQLFYAEFAPAETFVASTATRELASKIEALGDQKTLQLVPDFLRIIETSEVRQFKARTAMGSLALLQECLEEKFTVPAELRAHICYLRGLCLTDLGRQQEAADYLLQAQRLHPMAQRYREAAALALARTDDRMADAEALAKQLRAQAPDAAVGWAVWTGLGDAVARHAQVPVSIREQPAYRAALLAVLMPKERYDEARTILLPQLETVRSRGKMVYLSDQITAHNYGPITPRQRPHYGGNPGRYSAQYGKPTNASPALRDQSQNGGQMAQAHHDGRRADGPRAGFHRAHGE